MTEEELLALSDEDKVKYLKEKRDFNFDKALESLKTSMLELRKVNEKVIINSFPNSPATSQKS